MSEPEVDEETSNQAFIDDVLLSILSDAKDQAVARQARHDRLMTPAYVQEIGQLIAGDESGWQTRFAAAIGVTRTHIANLVGGKRRATEEMRKSIADAALAAADELEERAKKLRKISAQLRF